MPIMYTQELDCTLGCVHLDAYSVNNKPSIHLHAYAPSCVHSSARLHSRPLCIPFHMCMPRMHMPCHACLCMHPVMAMSWCHTFLAVRIHVCYVVVLGYRLLVLYLGLAIRIPNHSSMPFIVELLPSSCTFKIGLTKASIHANPNIWLMGLCQQGHWYAKE